jgi:hypothetical protein
VILASGGGTCTGRRIVAAPLRASAASLDHVAVVRYGEASLGTDVLINPAKCRVVPVDIEIWHLPRHRAKVVDQSADVKERKRGKLFPGVEDLESLSRKGVNGLLKSCIRTVRGWRRAKRLVQVGIVSGTHLLGEDRPGGSKDSPELGGGEARMVAENEIKLAVGGGKAAARLLPSNLTSQRAKARSRD